MEDMSTDYYQKSDKLLAEQGAGVVAYQVGDFHVVAVEGMEGSDVNLYNSNLENVKNVSYPEMVNLTEVINKFCDEFQFDGIETLRNRSAEMLNYGSFMQNYHESYQRRENSVDKQIEWFQNSEDSFAVYTLNPTEHNEQLQGKDMAFLEKVGEDLDKRNFQCVYTDTIESLKENDTLFYGETNMDTHLQEALADLSVGDGEKLNTMIQVKSPKMGELAEELQTGCVLALKQDGEVSHFFMDETDLKKVEFMDLPPKFKDLEYEKERDNLLAQSLTFESDVSKSVETIQNLMENPELLGRVMEDSQNLREDFLSALDSADILKLNAQKEEVSAYLNQTLSDLDLDIVNTLVNSALTMNDMENRQDVLEFVTEAINSGVLEPKDIVNYGEEELMVAMADKDMNALENIINQLKKEESALESDTLYRDYTILESEVAVINEVALLTNETQDTFVVTDRNAFSEKEVNDNEWIMPVMFHNKEEATQNYEARVDVFKEMNQDIRESPVETKVKSDIVAVENEDNLYSATFTNQERVVIDCATQHASDYMEDIPDEYREVLGDILTKNDPNHDILSYYPDDYTFEPSDSLNETNIVLYSDQELIVIADVCELYRSDVEEMGENFNQTLESVAEKINDLHLEREEELDVEAYRHDLEFGEDEENDLDFEEPDTIDMEPAVVRNGDREYHPTNENLEQLEKEEYAEISYVDYTDKDNPYQGSEDFSAQRWNTMTDKVNEQSKENHTPTIPSASESDKDVVTTRHAEKEVNPQEGKIMDNSAEKQAILTSISMLSSFDISSLMEISTELARKVGEAVSFDEIQGEINSKQSHLDLVTINEFVSNFSVVENVPKDEVVKFVAEAINQGRLEASDLQDLDMNDFTVAFDDRNVDMLEFFVERQKVVNAANIDHSPEVLGDIQNGLSQEVSVADLMKINELVSKTALRSDDFSKPFVQEFVSEALNRQLIDTDSIDHLRPSNVESAMNFSEYKQLQGFADSNKEYSEKYDSKAEVSKVEITEAINKDVQPLENLTTEKLYAMTVDDSYVQRMVKDTAQLSKIQDYFDEKLPMEDLKMVNQTVSNIQDKVDEHEKTEDDILLYISNAVNEGEISASDLGTIDENDFAEVLMDDGRLADLLADDVKATVKSQANENKNDQSPEKNAVIDVKSMDVETLTNEMLKNPELNHMVKEASDISVVSDGLKDTHSFEDLSKINDFATDIYLKYDEVDKVDISDFIGSAINQGDIKVNDLDNISRSEFFDAFTNKNTEELGKLVDTKEVSENMAKNMEQPWTDKESFSNFLNKEFEILESQVVGNDLVVLAQNSTADTFVTMLKEAENPESLWVTPDFSVTKEYAEELYETNIGFLIENRLDMPISEQEAENLKQISSELGNRGEKSQENEQSEPRKTDSPMMYCSEKEAVVKNNLSEFYESLHNNKDCAKFMINAMNSPEYNDGNLSLEDILGKSVEMFGEERTNAVLAASIHEYNEVIVEDRYWNDNPELEFENILSDETQNWVSHIELPDEIAMFTLRSRDDIVKIETLVDIVREKEEIKEQSLETEQEKPQGFVIGEQKSYDERELTSDEILQQEAVLSQVAYQVGENSVYFSSGEEEFSYVTFDRDFDEINFGSFEAMSLTEGINEFVNKFDIPDIDKLAVRDVDVLDVEEVMFSAAVRHNSQERENSNETPSQENVKAVGDLTGDIENSATESPRIVAGSYEITDSIVMGGEEIALGESPSGMAGTWERSIVADESKGIEDNWYSGHYFSDKEEAVVDFQQRIEDKLQEREFIHGDKSMYAEKSEDKDNVKGDKGKDSKKESPRESVMGKLNKIKKQIAQKDTKETPTKDKSDQSL